MLLANRAPDQAVMAVGMKGDHLEPRTSTDAPMLLSNWAPAQVVMAVGVKGERLELHAPTDPPELRELAMRCMAVEPKARPAFADIIAALRAMLCCVAAVEAARECARASEAAAAPGPRRRGTDVTRSSGRFW